MIVCEKCQSESHYDSSYMSHGGHKYLKCMFCGYTAEYWYSMWHGWLRVEEDDE